MDRQRESELRRQLLMQRLEQLETEHVAAAFALEQIELNINEARRQLESPDGTAPTTN